MSDYILYKGAWVWSKGPYLEKKLSKKQCKTILSGGGYFVRNTYDFDCSTETGFWYVIKDSFNGLQDVPSKYRARVKKSLESFEIKRITREYLIEHGYDVYVKAAENYRIKATIPTYDDFKLRIMEGDETIDLWGSVHKETGELAAFAINHIVDNTVDYQTMKFHPEYLSKLHVSYGLIYEMNRYYLEEKKMLFVNDGARSLTNHSDVQPFLMQKFKFRKAYCKLSIVYKPWFGTIIKLLYPLRGIIRVGKVSAILYQETMARESM